MMFFQLFLDDLRCGLVGLRIGLDGLDFKNVGSPVTACTALATLAVLPLREKYTTATRIFAAVFLLSAATD